MFNINKGTALTITYVAAAVGCTVASIVFKYQTINPIAKLVKNIEREYIETFYQKNPYECIKYLKTKAHELEKESYKMTPSKFINFLQEGNFKEIINYYTIKPQEYLKYLLEKLKETEAINNYYTMNPYEYLNYLKDLRQLYPKVAEKFTLIEVAKLQELKQSMPDVYRQFIIPEKEKLDQNLKIISLSQKNLEKTSLDYVLLAEITKQLEYEKEIKNLINYVEQEMDMGNINNDVEFIGENS